MLSACSFTRNVLFSAETRARRVVCGGEEEEEGDEGQTGGRGGSGRRHGGVTEGGMVAAPPAAEETTGSPGPGFRFLQPITPGIDPSLEGSARSDEGQQFMLLARLVNQ